MATQICESSDPGAVINSELSQEEQAEVQTNTAAAAAATPVDLIDSVDDSLLTSGDDFGFSEMTSIYE